MNYKNGRLKFSNQSFLKATLTDLREKDLDDVSDKMAELYDEGFLSFRPIIDTDDEARVNAYLETKNSRPKLKNVFNNKSKLKSLNEEEIEDELEDLIADDELACLINENGEIQVGDSLYKYTDSGLYIVHINDESHLNNYLEQDTTEIAQSIDSTNLTKRSRLDREELCFIDDKIRRFRYWGRTTQYSSSYRSNNNYVLKHLPKEFKDFPVTNGRQTFFGGIFGSRRAATANFSKRRRVKVLYVNQKYLLSSRVGIIVKYQRRKCRIWWRYKADELVAGINQAFFTLEYKVPNINTVPKTTLYYEGRVYNNYYRELHYNKNSGVPNIPFNDEISVNVNLPLLGWNKYNYTAEQMNNFAWDKAYKYVEGLMTKLRKPMPKSISVVAIGHNKVYINSMNLVYTKKNARYIKKFFNREYRTPDITLGFNDAGGMNIKKLKLPELMDASTINLDFYGGARRGNEWKGFRMIYND